MLEKWKEVCISPKTSILQGIEIIDSTAFQILLVIDGEGRLLGTVTDGDIRRAILKGISLDKPIEDIMCTEPTVVTIKESQKRILSIMKKKRLQHIPVINDKGFLVDVKVLSDLLVEPIIENVVILMVGGLGTRLYPLTQECPKPLLKVGSKPILETILENFIEQGFSNFYFTVNYKAEMIKGYFGDGSKWNVSIQYVHEKTRMGTAGALTLIEQKFTKPVIVMNGDILTRVNFRHLLDFHEKNNSMATMCIREYNYQIPYGVVKTEDYYLTGIEEKPVYNFFVNAGIYVLNPEVFSYIPSNSFFDMPVLFENLASTGNMTTVFPIHEYWLDIGQMRDYERANGEFNEVFLK